MPWEYDPTHSHIMFENKYLGILTIRGRFRSAQVILDVADADLTRSSIKVTIDAASIETDIPRRDDTLRSDQYLDVERYPSITFTSSRIERRGDRHAIIGDLTIHGVTRQVELDAVFNGEAVDGRGIVRRGFSARTTISRADFGVHVNVDEPVPISAEEVRILLEIAATKTSSPLATTWATVHTGSSSGKRESSGSIGPSTATTWAGPRSMR